MQNCSRSSSFCQIMSNHFQILIPLKIGMILFSLKKIQSPPAKGSQEQQVTHK